MGTGRDHNIVLTYNYNDHYPVVLPSAVAEVYVVYGAWLPWELLSHRYNQCIMISFQSNAKYVGYLLNL